MTISKKIERNGSRKFLLLPAIGLIAMMSACASAPKLPNDQVGRAEAAINRAEEARVADYASAELRAAREKLAAAREMMQKAASEKDERAATRAGWLAEESISDAELATAKAQEARAKAVNQEMEGTIDLLQDELQRGQ